MMKHILLIISCLLSVAINHAIAQKFKNSAGARIGSIKVNIENSLFFFVEPGVQLELNITKFMKLNTGISYRFNHNLKLAELVSSFDLNNRTSNLSFVFGKF